MTEIADVAAHRAAMVVLAALRNTADLICLDARLETKRFAGEAINWGDLGCWSAEQYVTDEGATGQRVWISEASPDSPKLQAFVREGLASAGYPDVEVLTEW